MGLCIDQAVLPLKLVKSLINKGCSFITKWIDLWFNGIKVTLPVSMQGHGHLLLWRYLDKVERFSDRDKLIDKIRDLLNGQKLSVDSDFNCHTCLKAGF